MADSLQQAVNVLEKQAHEPNVFGCIASRLLYLARTPGALCLYLKYASSADELRTALECLAPVLDALRKGTAAWKHACFVHLAGQQLEMQVNAPMRPQRPGAAPYGQPLPPSLLLRKPSAAATSSPSTRRYSRVCATWRARSWPRPSSTRPSCCSPCSPSTPGRLPPPCSRPMEPPTAAPRSRPAPPRPPPPPPPPPPPRARSRRRRRRGRRRRCRSRCPLRPRARRRAISR